MTAPAPGRAAPPEGFAAGTILGENASTVTFEVLPISTVAGATRAVLVCKRLLPRMLREEAARASLDREGRALALLAGRSAPRLVTRGDDERGPFLLMERVPLASLRAHMDAGRCRNEAFLTAATGSAFEALREVHAAAALDFVHGDLSVDNLLLADDGRTACLVDFGLASWRGEPPPAGGAFRGTLLYAAPELARGEAADARADVFALAASLLHAASGRPPRTSTSAAAMLAEAAETPLDTAPLDALFSPGLRAFLRACLAFDANDRVSGKERS